MTSQSVSHRRCLVCCAAAGAALLLAVAAHAAPPVVEIVAYAHPPVQSALGPLRTWLAAQGSRLNVVEIDLETAAGAQRLKAVGVTGHVPVVVLIDGLHLHERADGSSVDLVGFPAGAGTPPSVKRSWTAADVEALLKLRMKCVAGAPASPRVRLEASPMFLFEARGASRIDKSGDVDFASEPSSCNGRQNADTFWPGVP